MYVCICNAIREADLVALARQQRGSPEELYAKLGFEPQCGECLSYADRVVAVARLTAMAAPVRKISAICGRNTLGLRDALA